MCQFEARTCSDNLIVDALHELGGDIQFPAEFADERNA